MAGGVRGDGGDGDPSLSVDEMLELVSNYQRRAILRHLRDTPGHVHSLDALITHLKDVERERHGEAPGDDHLLAIFVHVHGPKLEQAGLLDYDVAQGEVHYLPHELIEPLLERIETIADDLNHH